MNYYQDLKVWKESIDLTVDVYQLIRSFPDDEKYVLVSQIRRSAISISSNISEGAGRNNNKEFIQFIGIAFGSCAELETQLIISNKLGYIEMFQLHEIFARINYIKNMLYKLKDSIKLKTLTFSN